MIEDKKNDLVIQNTNIVNGVFSSKESFDNAQRMALAISKSDIVPKSYQNNVSNCLVAIEMSNRINISPLMVMQNLDVINGKPSWRSQFIISALNACGKFSPLRFKFSGEKGKTNYGCVAYATDLSTGEVIEGVKVDWEMVIAEGWRDKSGSKWKTMPELMFHYRAAAFFGRLYAPEILTGMHSIEENIDIFSQRNTQSIIDDKFLLLTDLREDKEDLLSDEDKTHIDRIINNKEVLSYDKAIKALKSL